MQKVKDNGDGYVTFWCPACNSSHGITTADGEPWDWNGDEILPTVSTPVLVDLISAGTKCRSKITAGQIHFLAESSHSMAGQTVELPEWPENG